MNTVWGTFDSLIWDFVRSRLCCRAYWVTARTNISESWYPAKTYSSSYIHFAAILSCVRCTGIFWVAASYRSSSCCSLSCYDNSCSAFCQTCSFWYMYRSDTGTAAHHTEPLLGTGFRFLSAAFVPGAGKAWACLERQPVLRAGIQAIFLLEDRRQIWGTKRDRGCVGSSLSCRGTVVLFVKATTGVAWRGDAGRWGWGSSSAELSVCSTAFPLIYPPINQHIFFMLAKKWAQCMLPSRRAWRAWYSGPIQQIPCSACLCARSHLKPGNLESSSGQHDPPWVCHILTVRPNT